MCSQGQRRGKAALLGENKLARYNIVAAATVSFVFFLYAPFN